MLVYILGGLAAIAFGVIAVVLWMRRDDASRPRDEGDEDLTIDLLSLTETVLPPGPHLEFYGVPVRLMVLVIAPAGRGDPLTRDELPEAVESLLPNIMPVLDNHQPIFRLWPAQMSTSGFQHAFFSNIALPGVRGKGTKWCGVVGRFHHHGRPLLAGLTCVAATENGLSEVTVEHEGRWLDVLRVRG